MRSWLLVCVLLLSGCHTVVREARVLRMELTWFSKASTDQAKLLRHFVLAHCQCDGDKVVGAECKKAARTLLVAESRTEWHRDMSLYNAGLIEKRPGERPEIPKESVLCKEMAQ